MKNKFKNLSILIAFVLIMPLQVYATKGACSYHSGVNCSAGASSLGKVQCNDGWINSSVYFSDAEECKVSIDYCPKVLYFTSSCNVESDYTRVKERVDGMRGSQSAINARRGLLGSSFDTSSTVGQEELDNCRKGIDIYNRMVSSREKCLDEEKAIKLKKDLETEKYLLEEVAKLKEMESYRIDNIFQENFKKAIISLPEYKNIVDSNLIKEMSLRKENGNKTFVQIIIDTYSNKLPIKINTSISSTTSTSTNQVKVITKFTRNLKKGSKGEDVKYLQTVLKKLNYLPSTHNLSTIFGNITEKALMKFQKDNNIKPASGFMGEITQAKLIYLSESL